MRKITFFLVLSCLGLFSAIHATNRVNLALGKTVSARVNDMNGASSNDETAYFMTDGDENTVWESANSYKHSILIDLGTSYKITKVVIKWVDGQACNSCDLNFGQASDRMERAWSSNDLTETVESVHDDLNVEARFFELVLRGRIVAGKPYKIKEIEIYGVDNLAFGKTVTTRINSSTGDFSNNETANLITDGDVNTYWEATNNYKVSVMIDLGAVYDITKMVIKWADGQACVSSDLSFGLETNKMVRLWSRNDLTESVESVHDGMNERARYVELLMRGRMDGKNYRIREIEIYNEGYVPHENTVEQQEAIDSITSRLIQKQIDTSFSDANTSSYSSAMLSDGSWSDIDYNDGISADGWQPNTHLNRLKEMALSFRNPQSTWYENAALLGQIENGLLYFKNTAPYCTDNWWYNDIGGPQIYMIPLLLLKDHIEAKNMYIISTYLKNQIERFKGGGKNLTWIAEISMYKGCAENDFSIVKNSFEAMASTLVIVPVQGDEGIKIDGSFHQHHSQLYSGGYGLSMVADISNALELSNGTLFDDIFTTDKKEIYRNLVLDGILLLSHRNIIDFGTVGRNISRNSTNSTLGVTYVEREINRGGDDAAIYQAWKNHIEGNGPFPLSNINKHFWKSDIMVQHGDNYYMSAKIISSRTYGTEALNNENIKGYNLPLGATNILMSGLEYHKIYPIWDWTKIPGTTAVQNQDYTKLDDYLIGSNDFGGGVSNRSNGIIAYEHNYLGLSAKKAYFFIDGMMFCMGNGITFNQNESVATSVNQSFLSGDVTINAESTETLASQSSKTSDNLHWVHHNNVGYIFSSEGNVTVQNMSQTGSWREINATGVTSSITKDVFSLWFNHGNNPTDATYQYIVVPDKSLTDFQTTANNHGFIVTENNSTVQALRKGNQYGIIFYEAGTATMDDGLSITSDKAAMVLVEKDDQNLQISVSDPTYSASEIKLTLNRMFEGVDSTPEGNTELAFILPDGDYTGSTVTKSFEILLSDNTSVLNVTINGEPYNMLNNYILDCDCDIETFTVNITPANGTTVTSNGVSGNIIEVKIDKPEIKEVSFTVTSPSGNATQDYKFNIEKRFSFSSIVTQKWNNLLIVNNNPQTNGGYVFNDYKWFKNDLEMASGKQFYSVGDNATDLLDRDALYYVQVTTDSGDVLKTCPASPVFTNSIFKAYPNPVRAGEPLYIEVGIDEKQLANAKFRIYNMTGTMDTTIPVASNRVNTINLNKTGIYIIQLVTSDNDVIETKVIVK
jgi:chondroitin AC lyase